MSDVICFERKLDSLVLEEVKLQAEQSWHSSQVMPTEVVDTLVAEVERLRELIPDAGMLHRLTYAAEMWWEGYGSQSQKDIKAGYALVERLHVHEEANVDET